MCVVVPSCGRRAVLFRMRSCGKHWKCVAQANVLFTAAVSTFCCTWRVCVPRRAPRGLEAEEEDSILVPECSSASSGVPFKTTSTSLRGTGLPTTLHGSRMGGWAPLETASCGPRNKQQSRSPPRRLGPGPAPSWCKPPATRWRCSCAPSTTTPVRWTSGLFTRICYAVGTFAKPSADNYAAVYMHGQTPCLKNPFIFLVCTALARSYPDLFRASGRGLEIILSQVWKTGGGWALFHH